MLDVYAFYEGNDNYTNSSSNDFIMGFTFGKLSFMDIYILTYYDQKSINLEYDIKYDYSKRFSFRKRNFFFLILWLLMVMDLK